MGSGFQDPGRDLANVIMRAAATPQSCALFKAHFDADADFRARIEAAVNYHLASIATDSTGTERYSRFTRTHDIYRRSFEKLDIEVETASDATVKRCGKTAADTATVLLPQQNQFSDSQPSLYWLRLSQRVDAA